MKPEEKITTMTGISKRLFVALCDFRGTPPQLEDALFQLASVIDSTSKGHYPNEQSSKRRFVNYLDSVMTDIYRIATSGRATLVDCTFQTDSNDPQTFGEIIYAIRCSSYHDPNEVDDLVHWGDENHIGIKNGKFTINKSLLMSLFLILISDEQNKDLIDLELFNDDNYLTIDDSHYPFSGFVGNRQMLFNVLGL